MGRTRLGACGGLVLVLLACCRGSRGRRRPAGGCGGEGGSGERPRAPRATRRRQPGPGRRHDGPALGGLSRRSGDGETAGQRQGQRQGREPLRRDAPLAGLHQRERGDRRRCCSTPAPIRTPRSAAARRALMTAARTGKLGPVQALLARGADVNAKERRGQTALMWAAAEGHAAVVEALLKAGADFRTPLPSGFTPCSSPCARAAPTSSRILLKAGADVNETMQTRTVGRQGPAPGTTPVDPGRRERPLRARGRPAEGRRRPERPALRLHGPPHPDLGPQAESGRRARRRSGPDRLREADQPRSSSRKLVEARRRRQRSAQGGDSGRGELNRTGATRRSSWPP